MKKLLKSGVFALSALFMLGAPQADAADVVDGPRVKWNYAAWGNPKASQWTIFQKFSEFVEERTGGQFTVDIHYGQLAKPNAILDGIQVGAFQGGTILSAYYPGKLPATSGLDLPFLALDNSYQHAKVTDAYMNLEDVKAEFNRSNASYFMALVVPEFEVVGKGTPPNGLDDWKGRRLRLLGAHGDAMKSLGAVPRPIPGANTYGAMDRGELDGISMPHVAFMAYKLYEVSDWYTSNLRLGSVNAVMAFNSDAVAELPDQYKALLEEYKEIGYDHQIAALSKVTAAGPATYKEAGLTEVKLSDDEFAELVDVAGRPVWDAWIAKMDDRGVDGAALFQAIKDLSAEHKDAGPKS